MDKLPMILKRDKLVPEKKMRWKDLTKIAVSGSRAFKEPDLAAAYVDKYISLNFESTEDVVILTGGAIGVDDAIERMCTRRGIKNFIFNARWLEFSRAAGPIRNQQIIDLAQELIAFPADKREEARGTRDTIRRAKKKGIPCRVIRIKRLRKFLGIPTPRVLKVPSGTSPRLVKKVLRKDSIKKLASVIDLEDLLK